MAINFPTSPALNDEYTFGTRTWVWNGTAWYLKQDQPDVLLDLIKTVDGAGSGLDADLVDGEHAAAFYPASNPSGFITASSDITGNAATVTNGVYLNTVQTLTNKRITSRVQSVASSATMTPDADAADVYIMNGLATASTVNAPTGTPTNGQKLIIRIEDNGTPRALTWTTTSGAYRAVGVVLPTTTVASKVLYVGVVYNSDDVFWDVIAVAQLA